MAKFIYSMQNILNLNEKLEDQAKMQNEPVAHFEPRLDVLSTSGAGEFDLSETMDGVLFR